MVHKSGAATTTVRVTQQTRDTLRELADELDEPILAIVEKAVEAYWRQYVIERSNAAYAALQADPEAWQEEFDEREAWEATLRDGLEGSH